MRLSLAVAVLAPFALGAQSPAPRVRTSTVSGTVFDSIGRAPLAGASVQLLGTSGPANARMLTTTADSLGRFRLDSVPYGEYVAGFFHQAVDSLGIDVKSRAVRIGSARQRVDLSSPSPREMITAFCGAAALRDSTALLIGHVRRADSEQTVVGADVLLEWNETTFERGRGAVTTDRTASARTIAGGWFALCGVPAGSPLLTRAAFGADTSGYVEHESVARAVEHVTFVIGRTQWRTIGDSSTGPQDSVRVRRGSARLSGKVLTNQGQPANAQVDVPGTGLATRTNSAGSFTLDSLPSGTLTVTIRAIGFAPTDHAVHLAEGRATTVHLHLPERAVALGPVEVVASKVYSRKLQIFEMNRRRGAGGSFYRPSPENALEHATIVTMVQQSPRFVVRFVDGQYIVLLPLPRGRQCRPSLWVDGSRFRFGPQDDGAFDALNMMYGPGQILALEVYAFPLGMPGQYMDTGCGAIAVWTQEPAPKK